MEDIFGKAVSNAATKRTQTYPSARRTRIGEDEVDPETGEVLSHDRVSAWKEAPQQVFNSWEDAQQLRYQIARDEDQLEFEGDPFMVEFYTKRIATNKAELDELLEDEAAEQLAPVEPVWRRRYFEDDAPEGEDYDPRYD